jgi:DNA (cytosine-5)-methyltransferase 1
LFSGIGGFAIAAGAAGFRTIGFSEIEPYACKLLGQHWPGVRNFGDIRNVTREAVADAAQGGIRRGRASRETGQPALGGETVPGGPRDSSGIIDLLTGGFPCQPFSVAGKQRGAADDRHLWPEMCRVIDECRPAWVLGENVPGIIGMELDRVLSDLENLSYTCWPVVVPACAVDARHRRDRVWIVAYSERDGFASCANAGITGEIPGAEPSGENHSANAPGASSSGALAKGKRPRLEKRGKQPTREERSPAQRSGEAVANRESELLYRSEPDGDAGGRGGFANGCQWPVEPAVGRVAHGIPARSHRLKGLGNAIVPQVAEVFLRAIRAQL